MYTHTPLKQWWEVESSLQKSLDGDNKKKLSVSSKSVADVHFLA